jgi:PEP-CTERM motif
MFFGKRSIALFAAALALVMLSGTAVRADFIPWTYNWTRNPIAVPADPGGTGGIALTNEPVNHAVGSSDIVATELRTFSSASASTPDTFTNAPFSLTLTLTDDNSHQTTSLTFNGVFNGSFSAGSANITASWTGSTSQTVVLGNDTYAVSMTGYSPPGPPGSANAGSIGTHVDVSAGSSGGGGGGGGGGDPGPPANPVPEPSTLALSGLGLSFLGLASWRKWKRRVA